MSTTSRSAAGFTRRSSPVERSSSTSTVAPPATQASTTCDPMNPAPPVTMTLAGTAKPSSSTGSALTGAGTRGGDAPGGGTRDSAPEAGPRGPEDPRRHRRGAVARPPAPLPGAGRGEGGGGGRPPLFGSGR